MIMNKMREETVSAKAILRSSIIFTVFSTKFNKQQTNVIFYTRQEWTRLLSIYQFACNQMRTAIDGDKKKTIFLWILTSLLVAGVRVCCV